MVRWDGGGASLPHCWVSLTECLLFFSLCFFSVSILRLCVIEAGVGPSCWRESLDLASTSYSFAKPATEPSST